MVGLGSSIVTDPSSAPSGFCGSITSTLPFPIDGSTPSKSNAALPEALVSGEPIAGQLTVAVFVPLEGLGADG